MEEQKENKQIENSSLKQVENQSNDLTTLTDQNWLFINAFLQTGNIVKSYKIAGYKGENRSAPYQLFKQLKARIEDLGDLDVTSRARLQADLKQVLDLPLDPNKTHLSLSEWLRIRKFSASITPEVSKDKPQISVLVIQRGNKEPLVNNEEISVNFGKGDSEGGKGINSHQHSPNKDVILDAEIIDPKT